MILLITGQPGSGKTLRAMWYLRYDDTYKDRPIYSNINGSGHQEIPESDWRKCPDGSVIVVDECQFWWPQRKAGLAIPEQVSAMDTHRHRGIDLILITQRPTGVDHHVRGLVGRHEHLKSFSKSSSSLWWRNETWDCMDGKERKAHGTQTKLWSHPKEIYGTYSSAVIHTHRFKIPKKFILAGLIVVAFIVAAILAVSKISGMVDGPPSPDLAIQSHRTVADSTLNSDIIVSRPELDGLPLIYEQSPRIAGCIYRHRDQRCRCYDSAGIHVRTAYGVCMDNATGSN